MGIDSDETAIGSGLNRQSIDYVERLEAAVDGGSSANADGEPASRSARNSDTGHLGLENFFNRLRGVLVEVVGGYRGAGQRTRRRWVRQVVNRRRYATKAAKSGGQRTQNR